MPCGGWDIGHLCQLFLSLNTSGVDIEDFFNFIPLEFGINRGIGVGFLP